MVATSIIFIVAVVTAWTVTPLVIRLAGVWGVFDSPHGNRRVHTQPLPRLGGVAVFGAMAASLLVAGLISAGGFELLSGSPGFIFSVLFGGSIVFATGLADDLRGLRPVTKLTAQIVAAGIVYIYGFRLDTLSFGPDAHFSLGWLALPLTLFWIVAVTNAFNLIDGLDGLSSGIAIVGVATTMAVAGALGAGEAVLLGAALLGALIGFIRYNMSPASIFLGDSGSLSIGFMLAILSVHGSTAGGSVLILVPLFALAIPLLDTSLAVLRRWLRGVPLSQADGRHIHHRLLAAGLSHPQAVWLLHVTALMLALLGVSLAFAPPPAIASIAAAGGGITLLGLLWGLNRLQYHEFTHAVGTLFSGLSRLRRIIRDQISAQDLSELLRRTDSVEELSGVLEDHAAVFEFLHMEVCRESAVGPKPLLLFNGNVARAWKLDYPVMPHDFVDGDDFVLRIWCNPRRETRPYGAERVAQMLAPVIEARLTEIGERGLRSRVQVAAGAEREADMVEREVPADRPHVAPARLGGLRPTA